MLASKTGVALAFIIFQIISEKEILDVLSRCLQQLFLKLTISFLSRKNTGEHQT